MTATEAAPAPAGKRGICRWATAAAVEWCVFTDAEIDHRTQAVFIAMATFVGTRDADRANPVCFASHDRIAERARVSTSTAQRAIAALEVLGWIARVGHAQVAARVRTVKYAMSPLSVTMTDKGPDVPHAFRTDSARERTMDEDGLLSVTLTDKGTDEVTDRRSVTMTDKSSHLL